MAAAACRSLFCEAGLISSPCNPAFAAPCTAGRHQLYRPATTYQRRPARASRTARVCRRSAGGGAAAADGRGGGGGEVAAAPDRSVDATHGLVGGCLCWRLVEGLNSRGICIPLVSALCPACSSWCNASLPDGLQCPPPLPSDPATGALSLPQQGLEQLAAELTDPSKPLVRLVRQLVHAGKQRQPMQVMWHPLAVLSRLPSAFLPTGLPASHKHTAACAPLGAAARAAS